MMRLFKHCHVFAPENRGIMDILTAGEKVIAVGNGIDPGAIKEIERVECSGLSVIPGLIDGHAHIAGAGGEGGPSTRTPGMKLTDFVANGITTVIGMLGTDGIVREPASVLMKARSLHAEGMTALMLTGSYQLPPVTLTGDAGRDIILIPEVLGAGEIAVSDHRDSAPQWPELARLAKTIRVAGMLAGKPGVVCLHLGDAPGTFDIVLDAVRIGNCPFKHFLPTHCNRSAEVFEAAISFGKQGGWLDLTTSAYPYFPDEEIKPSEAIMRLLSAGVPATHICMSSDAGGSLPDFDASGNLRSLTTGDPGTIYHEIRDLIRISGLPVEQAITFAGRNVADIFGLSSKGRIVSGADADLVFLDSAFEIRYVIARGRDAVREGKTVLFGTFQQ